MFATSRHRWEGRRRRGLDSFHGDAPPEPLSPTTPNEPLGHRRFNCCRAAQSGDRAIVVVSANRAPDKSIVEPRDGLGLAIVSFCRTSGALRRDWRIEEPTIAVEESYSVSAHSVSDAC